MGIERACSLETVREQGVSTVSHMVWRGSSTHSWVNLQTILFQKYISTRAQCQIFPLPQKRVFSCVREKVGPPDKLLAHCKQVDLPTNQDLWVVHVDVFALGGGD